MLSSSRTPGNPALSPIVPAVLPVSVRRNISGTIDADKARVIALELHSLVQGMTAISEVGELLIEDFSILYATYLKLARLGVRFDAGFVVHMQDLADQCLDLPDDGDYDDADSRLDHDDPDADADCGTDPVWRGIFAGLHAGRRAA